MRRALIAPALVIATGLLVPFAPERAAHADASASVATAPNELDRLLARFEGEERALRTELGEIAPKLEITRKRMVARGRAYYRLMRAGLLPAGGGFDALVDHAAHVERTRMALERDIVGEAALIKRSGEIEARLARIRAERAPLEVQREAMARARMALQEVDERRAAFARAFETSTRPDAMAVYGADTGPIEADTKAGFRSLKGRLPFPIAGRAEVKKVSRYGGPGVELLASSGAAARAVAAGRVAFADRYDDYGLTVILDHGDHYYSVYANLRSTEVRAGDGLPSGGRIGMVGGDGTHGTALYFELRHKASTLDPSPWLGI
jgi:murein DD-endopeptidase MepM/ murein hydrolase activator NlpD